MPASPGAAVGEIVLDNAQALERTAAGAHVILVRRETNPDDLQGMIVADGVLTARGGKTSHAAVVARGMGTCAVVGAEELDVDPARGEVRVRGEVLRAGDTIAIDGATGEVFRGEVPVVDSPVMVYVSDGLDAGLAAAADPEARALVTAVDRVLRHADHVRRMHVRTNADSAEDARRARARGAEGVGLCRTEHQFLGDRRQYIERLVLADTDDARREALDALLPLQREDFVGLLEAMDGLPTTIRLIDPPLHEFLPDLTELAVKVAVATEPDPQGRRAPGGRGADARAEPDARPARGAPRADAAGPVRAPGAGDRRGDRAAAPGGAGPAAGDHGAAGRVRAGAAAGPRGGRARAGGGQRVVRRPARRTHRLHDRAARAPR